MITPDIHGYNFGVHLSGVAPACPFLGSGFPCGKFLVRLARSACFNGFVRCSNLPSWVSSGSKCFAVLHGDILRV